MIEYVVLMGLDQEEKDIGFQELLSLEPEILQVYPPQLELPSYLQNYKMWCFPEGYTILDENMVPLNNEPSSSVLKNESFVRDEQKVKTNIRDYDQIYHFVMTDETAKKRYCTALLVYEKVYVQNSKKHSSQISKGFPKVSLQKIFNNPLILDEDTQIIYCPRTISFVSHEPNFDLQVQMLTYLYQQFLSRKEPITVQVQHSHLKLFDSYILQYGIFKAEQVWKTEILERDSECFSLKIKHHHLREFYLSLLFTKFDLEGCLIIQDILEQKSEPITKHNVNYLDCKRESSQNELLRVHTNTGEFLALQNFSFRPLFTRLSLTNISKSNNLYSSPVTLEKFHQQLKQYSNQFSLFNGTASIYRLPPQNCGNTPQLYNHIQLDSLKPIKIKQQIKQKKILENIEDQQRIIIDLDEDSVVQDESKVLQLPEKLQVILKSELFPISQLLNLNLEENSAVWIEIIQRTRLIYYELVLNLVQDVSVFLRPIQMRSTDKFQISNIKNIFDIDGYLAQFSEDNSEFITYICQNTMMFTEFVERVDGLISQNKHDSIIDSYLESCKQISKVRGYYDCWKNHPREEHKIDLYPQLIKYIKFLDLRNILSDSRVVKSKKPNIFQEGQLWRNILYFFNQQQRKQTRQTLNQRQTLLAQFRTTRIVDLQQIFTPQVVNSVLQGGKPISQCKPENQLENRKRSRTDIYNNLKGAVHNGQRKLLQGNDRKSFCESFEFINQQL